MQLNTYKKKNVAPKRKEETGNTTNLKLVDSMKVLRSNQIAALESIAMLLVREIEQMRRLDSRLMEGLERGKGISLYDELQAIEATIIRNALIRTGGVQVKAAKLLGIKVTTLNMKVKRYRIEIGEVDSE